MQIWSERIDTGKTKTQAKQLCSPLYLVVCFLPLSFYCELRQLPKIPSFRKLNTIQLRNTHYINKEDFHRKPQNCIQLLYCRSFPPTPLIIHTEISQISSALSVTETTPDSDEVLFKSHKCFHRVLSEDTRTRAKLRQHTNWSWWWQRALDHTDVKRNVKASDQKKKREGGGQAVNFLPPPLLPHLLSHHPFWWALVHHSNFRHNLTHASIPLLALVTSFALPFSTYNCLILLLRLLPR